MGDAIENVLVLKESLEDAYELTQFIKYSPKHQAALQRRQELKTDNLSLTVNTSEQWKVLIIRKFGFSVQQDGQLEQKHSTPSTITTNQSKNG